MDKVSFLSTIRRRTDVLALIPIDAVMGIPSISNDIWHIVFYKLLNEKKYIIHSEIDLAYPEGTLLRFQRIMNGEMMDYDEERLLALKKDFIDKYQDA